MAFYSDRRENIDKSKKITVKTAWSEWKIRRNFMENRITLKRPREKLENRENLLNKNLKSNIRAIST